MPRFLCLYCRRPIDKSKTDFTILENHQIHHHCAIQLAQDVLRAIRIRLADPTR